MSQTPSPIDSLRDILRPDQIVTEKVDTIPYACDGTAMLREVPDIVVFPDSVEQVVALVRWASRTGTPHVTRGSGSGLSGGRRGLGLFCGEVSGCHSTASVFDIWAMPEDGPPFGLQLRSGVFRTSMRWRGECLSRSRRLCSPLSRGNAI